MFERYTERARRVIFFARYESSQFGSTTIETEHFLLGLLREDRNLTSRFLREASSIETIRKEIEERSTIREKVSTSIDLPLSQECRRILACANEESEKLGHRHIGTEHLLLGILRQEGCMAARILNERGLKLEAIREELARNAPQIEGQSVQSHLLSPVYQSLMLKLDFGEFSTPKDHLLRAARAFSAHQFEVAEIELQHVLDSLVKAIQQGNPKGDVFASLVKGWDWPISLKDIHTGLDAEEDCKFKFNQTLMLAELLLLRYRKS